MNQNGDPIPFDRATILGTDGKAETPHITAEMCMANASHGVAPDQVIAMALVGILDQMEQTAGARDERQARQVKIEDEMFGYVRDYIKRAEADRAAWEKRLAEMPEAPGGPNLMGTGE